MGKAKAISFHLICDMSGLDDFQLGKIFICTKKTDFDSVYKNENCDPNIPYILKIPTIPNFVFIKLV